MEQSSQNNYLIPVAIVIAGVLVAGAIYFGANTGGPVASQDSAVTTEVDLDPVTEQDHIVGSRNAALVIVEYSDTECPYCKVFHQTMQEIVSSYNGEVSWVYRHFPIAGLHAKAPREAEATECAAELGGNQAFWNYINKLFETTNSNDSLEDSELPRIATAIGLDEEAFNACLSSGRHTESITQSIESAIRAGALGTPYSIIVAQDGRQVVINGAEPIDMVKVKIDALLEE
jgi:protein-disulfide isomerase